MSKQVLIPNEKHPITVTATGEHVVATVGGRVIADTREALTLQESTYPAVRYIPRKDVDFTLLERSEHETYCPYKGDASYYSIRAGETSADNAVWTYETPYDAVAEIKEYVAFYPNVVDVQVRED
ncbi:DUF427 domain-containing protein [Kutzneria kofuensis]|uniref:Uncharacterized protein (DUF427 family) n=1 Tax=Kutzneria kofuensis TaxID=103725 RepID=A0A7W9KBA0_9PSEU|nr:DUF427 domain-containing protein [Kutzneria kofuensis]MBB5889351.1 uncharacterized protein (DUF427 family) [Kutzneria kofuensis]